MKNLIVLLLLLTSFHVMAFQPDTSAYQTQRLKVNALLKERSVKFGQYDQSLDTRTGIFGLQTKDDIKNSNEILRQIVLNDNNTFKELKILMDYKDQEMKQAQNSANEAGNRMQNYMFSIKKLQDQNQQLKDKIEGQQAGKSIAWYLVILLAAALVYVIYSSRKKLKIQA
ncbi:hypothetical protein [Pedobacter frigoris]|uniref:hypothetical protein n=1 Tax=Pedobacter frigoris TaxID=2571272 RepID=UPI0019807402|nr:hypothetical protein [Pedobacter frigoris]